MPRTELSSSMQASQSEDKVFNSLPIEVRNVTRCSVEDFKCILDRYLQTVPDEPQIPGYISQRRADTNSLLDMARMAKARSNSLVDRNSVGPAKQLSMLVRKSTNHF